MTDWISKLEQAKRLLESGALTPEEFEAEKAKLLPQAPAPANDQTKPLPKRRSERKRPLSSTTIALGAVALIIASGAAFFHFVGNREQNGRPVTPVGPVSTSESPTEAGTARPEVERSQVGTEQCGRGALRVNLPGIGDTGSIVINYPLDDTDAMGGLEFAAGSFVCLTPNQLSKFATPSANAEMASDVLVSFSPNNGVAGALAYSVLFCSELDETPTPPRNVKIGAFKWVERGATSEVSVRWYSNFRRHVETTCFCDDGGIAPCEVQPPSDENTPSGMSSTGGTSASANEELEN